MTLMPEMPRLTNRLLIAVTAPASATDHVIGVPPAAASCRWAREARLSAPLNHGWNWPFLTNFASPGPFVSWRTTYLPDDRGGGRN